MKDYYGKLFGKKEEPPKPVDDAEDDTSTQDE